MREIVERRRQTSENKNVNSLEFGIPHTENPTATSDRENMTWVERKSNAKSKPDLLRNLI